MGWFQTSKPEHFRPETFPVFILEDEMGAWYGFPSLDDAGFKLGLFSHLKEVADPDKQDQKIYPADEEVWWWTFLLRIAVSCPQISRVFLNGSGYAALAKSRQTILATGKRATAAGRNLYVHEHSRSPLFDRFAPSA